MAKKNNKGAAPQAEETKKTVEVIDASKLRDAVNNRPSDGLDANHQVDMLMGLKTYFKDDPNAKNIFGEDMTDRVNNITAIGFISVLTNEVLFGKSNFAARMSVTQRQAVIELAPLAGVTINPKLLPAPESDGTAVITSNAVTVSEETKKAAKAEKEILDSKPTTDPTKVTNDKQLAKSIVYILADAKTEPRPAYRMDRAAEFLRSVQLIAAGKQGGEKAQETIQLINDKSVATLLNEISDLVGECTFTTVGLAHYINRVFSESKNPIPAFCLLRNASRNKKSGLTLSNLTLAAIVKVLVKWGTEPSIAKYKKAIEDARKTYKNNKKGFDEYTKPIYDNIKYCEDRLNTINEPSTDFVETLLDKYNENDITAKTIVRYILGSYYKTSPEDAEAFLNKDELFKDVQQMAGIIINAFRDPLSQDIRYSEANLTFPRKNDVQMVDVVESKKEEKEGEPSKN